MPLVGDVTPLVFLVTMLRNILSRILSSMESLNCLSSRVQSSTSASMFPSVAAMEGMISLKGTSWMLGKSRRGIRDGLRNAAVATYAS